MKKGLSNVFTLLLSLLAVSLVSFIGSLFTKIDSWYYAVRPAITPPVWVFPVVWNVVFLLIALSLYFAWTAHERKEGGHKILWIFGLNFLANSLWSFFYFTLHNPILAFLDIMIMLVTIVIMILVTKKLSKISAVLLIPYLLWVMFAALLNLLSI